MLKIAIVFFFICTLTISAKPQQIRRDQATMIDFVIPASYDLLSKVHNGMIYTLSGAKKPDSEDGFRCRIRYYGDEAHWKTSKTSGYLLHLQE